MCNWKTYLTKLSEKLIYLDVSVLTATCPSDLTVIPRGRPYNAVTQLRETPTCKSSFPGVHLVRGVTTWGQLMCLASSHSPWECICLPLVPCTWFTPGRGPLLGRICPRDSPEVAWVLHESGYSLLVLGIWPWSHLSSSLITVLWYRGPRPPRPYRGLLACRPLHGLSYPWVSGDDSIDTRVCRRLSWRCLYLATPKPSNAHTWRRPNWSTCWLSPLGPIWWVSPYVWLWPWLWLWSTPDDESVQKSLNKN